MLSDAEAIAMIAVKDLDVAAAFYEGTLGMSRVSTEGEEAITYRSGSSRFNVYRSQYARTNKATAMMWDVGAEVDARAAELKAKGVRFEHYDMPGLTLNGDVHGNADMKVAWFTDPDGNILSIVGS